MLFVYLHLFYIVHRAGQGLTPYDCRRWWDPNQRTPTSRPTCESPAVPLCYGRMFEEEREKKQQQKKNKKRFYLVKLILEP